MLKGSGILPLFMALILCGNIHAQNPGPRMHNILYINSYAMGYPWADSLVSGVQKALLSRKDIQVYIEFLDAKRFGKLHFTRNEEAFKEKYKNIPFDVVITSDNDALDFMMQYGDELAPDIPVVFCGINNPQDYKIEHSRYYGILDAVDLKTEINLITKIMPSVKNLYFITDNSTTSLLNLRYAKALEPEYSEHLRFNYINNYSQDSLINAVANFEKDGAIALINYYQDNHGNPVNSEVLYKEIAEKTSVPIFMDSETLLGKGIAGGIINNGAIQGREIANLALQFIDDPTFKPAMRVTLPRGRYFFDYQVLDKFDIPVTSLPSGSIVINQPEKVLRKYFKYLIALTGFTGFLLVTVLVLYLNVKRRRKAEDEVKTRLQEIEEKNKLLEQAHRQVNEMNSELEEVNEHLSRTNEALSIAKQRSEESDKLKSAFLANMSHEIRTPLNAIIGFSALLNESDITDEEKEEYFRVIGSNSEKLLRIIDDILDLSKIEAGQLKIYVESFKINEFFHEVVGSFAHSIPDGSVRIVLTESAHTDLIMKSDRSRFKQIISNLISNSIKFTRQGVIETGYNFDTPGEITFYVKDTGIGIEHKDLKNIFNRFWKADLNGEKTYAGAGLGLAISRKLCEALGGRIWVESEPGVGTTFFIAFQDYIIKKLDVERKSEPVELTGKMDSFTIAVAEDEKNNLYLLTRILRNFKLEVITFKTGKEIVDFFTRDENVKVDLILMDIKMPDMDGITASKLIRQIRPNIPIIAQTAYAMAEDIERIRSSSFNDYVSKPIRPMILIEKIKKYLYPEPA